MAPSFANADRLLTYIDLGPSRVPVPLAVLRKDTYYLSYDLWQFGVSNDPDEVGDEERMLALTRWYSWDC